MGHTGRRVRLEQHDGRGGGVRGGTKATSPSDLSHIAKRLYNSALSNVLLQREVLTVGNIPLFGDRLHAVSSSRSSALLTATMSSTQPQTTLYIKNLNDKVQKEELRHQLYAHFTTYGRVIDVVALKTQKMRGQAFVVFSDLAGATAALRACEGIIFYDKPMVRSPAH